MKAVYSLILFLLFFATSTVIYANNESDRLCTDEEIESYDFASIPMTRIHDINHIFDDSDTTVYLLNINYDAPGNVIYAKHNVPRSVEICFNYDEANPLWRPSNPQKFNFSTEIAGWLADDISISFDEDFNVLIHVIRNGEVVRFIMKNSDLGLFHKFSNDNVLALGSVSDFIAFMVVWAGLQ